MSGLFDRLQDEIDQRDALGGVSAVDLLDMPPNLRRLVQLLTRSGPLPAAAVGSQVGLDDAEVAALLAALAAKGHVRAEEVDGVVVYRVAFGRRRARAVPLDIWQALADRTQEDGDP